MSGYLYEEKQSMHTINKGSGKKNIGFSEPNFFGCGMPIPTTDVNINIYIDIPTGVETQDIHQFLHPDPALFQKGREKFPQLATAFELLIQLHEKCNTSEGALRLSFISLLIKADNSKRFMVNCICEKGKKFPERLEKSKSILEWFDSQIQLF